MLRFIGLFRPYPKGSTLRKGLKGTLRSILQTLKAPRYQCETGRRKKLDLVWGLYILSKRAFIEPFSLTKKQGKR